jgi:hypothetical protein
MRGEDDAILVDLQPDITSDEADELVPQKPMEAMTPRNVKRPRWVKNLVATKMDVDTLLKPISEYLC